MRQEIGPIDRPVERPPSARSSASPRRSPGSAAARPRPARRRRSTRNGTSRPRRAAVARRRSRAPSAHRASLRTGAARPRGGLGAARRRRDGALRQDAGEAVIDDAHDVEPRQLGIGLDADDAAFGRRDHAHRQARREDAAAAAGDDAVAGLDLGFGVEEDEARPVGIVAVEQRALARCPRSSPGCAS